MLKFKKSGKVVLPDQITLASALKWCFAEKAAKSSPRYGHVRRSVQMCFSALVRFLSHFPSPCPPTGSRVRPLPLSRSLSLVFGRGSRSPVACSHSRTFLPLSDLHIARNDRHWDEASAFLVHVL